MGRDYHDLGIQKEHRSFMDPIVDWLFENGAHRVDVCPATHYTSLSDEGTSIYHVNAYVEAYVTKRYSDGLEAKLIDHEFSEKVARMDIDALRSRGVMISRVDSGRYSSDSAYGIFRVEETMPVHVGVSHMTSDREEQKEIIHAYNEHMMADWDPEFHDTMLDGMEDAAKKK